MELSTLPTWAHQRGDLNQALEQLGNILGDLCDAPASSDTQCRAVTCILDHASSRFWRAFHALKKRKQDDHLNVAVLALTKSGKSTLLNALVGAELLPMNNVPETARICKVVHTVGQDPFLMEPVTDGQGSGGANRNQAIKQQITARGEAAVRERLHELNQAARERSFSSSSIRSRAPSTPLGPNSSQGQHLHTTGSLPSALEGLSAIQTRTSGPGPDAIDEEAEEQPAGLAATSSSGTPPAAATGLPTDNMLSIHAPVAALLEYAPTTSNQASSNGQDTPLSGVRLQLLDTPGPNEAGEEDLRHQVERLLDGVDVALYLLDYTKLKTQDEAGMFERLKVVNPALVKRLSQRLFFVVNKVDAAQTSEGQDLESTRVYVAELVTRQMGLDGFHLQPEQVLLLSARNALLSRLILRGTATPESKARFAQLAFGRFASPASIPQESWVAAAHALLADSGLLDLEAQVLAYLYTHAAAVKHLAVVDDLGRLLVEVRNVTTSCAAALSASAEALSQRVTEVRDQLTTTLAQFEAVQQDADAIGKEVAKEVNAHLHTLRGRLFSAIINALDTSNASIAAPPGSMARRWQGVRERFLSIFTGRGSGGVFSSQSSNISAGPLPGAAGVAYYSADGSVAGDVGPSGEAFDTAALLNAAGGAVARSRSRAELSALLVALHEDLTAQIHAEVREFWSVMEAVAAARHAELLTTLNTHLSQLSKQVESAVSRSLEIRLNPVSLSLAPPDASQFHADLNELLSRGLVETRERHIRVNQKQVTEQVLRKGGGICRWGDYWESVPRMRTVVEAYTLSVYEVVPSEITAHFISMVDSAVDATQTSLESYVSQFVGQQLEEARQQLQEYSNSYLGVMSGALDVTHKGSEQRMAALGQVLSLLTRLDDVQTRYDALQSATEGAVPRAQEAIAYDDLGDIIEDSEHSSDQEDDQEDNRTAPVQDTAVPQQEIFMSPLSVHEQAEEQAAAAAGQLEGTGGSAAAVGDVNAASVGVAAEKGVSAKAPNIPGSPMSVGSSTVNAMLRQPITALAASTATGTASSCVAPHATPVETDPEPSTPAAAGIVPSAAIILSPFAPQAAVAVEEGHTDTPHAPADDKEARDAAMGEDMPTLDTHTATLDVPFDYAKAMSCHLEAVSSSEGVGRASRGDGGVSDGAEGSDEWDLVDAEEEAEDEKARQPVLA